MNNNTNANGATFDPYLTWLGIRDPQRPPNHYRLLGLELFENDPEVIAAAADRQMTYVRTYQAGQQGEHSQRLLTELTTAKLCLLKPERKRDYDNRLLAAQKPAPLPPQQPPQARPLAAAMPPVNLATQHPLQQRPLPAAYAQPIPQAAPGDAYQNDQTRFGSPPVSVRASSPRAAKNNSVMQWSIVGGLVLATLILAVILANKFGSSDTPPVASNPTPPKVTPTAANNPASTPNPVTPSETNGQAQSVTETTEPKNPTAGTAPANPTKSSATDPEKARPGPVKAPLPNVVLPGAEEPSPPMPTPMNPAPMNPVPAVTPNTPTVPGTTAPANPLPMTVATNNEPLNSLPMPSDNNPTTPMPAPMGNPLNPLAEPANPLAMPNPLDGNPLNGELPKPAAPRRPIPSTKEIGESRTVVREIFKAAYAAKDPSLGKELLKSARESADKPAVMYTAYEEARLVSAAVNDLETAFAVHEEITREFAIELDKDLLDTVKAVAKGAPTMNAENAGIVLDIINEQTTSAFLEQRLETADQLLRIFPSFAVRVPDKTMRDTVYRELQKRLGEHKAFATKAAQYKETLAKNPDDGEANLELGKFWAFQQGNFEKGLGYLVKGSDAELREAAKNELTIPADSPEFGKVGAAWWEAANKLPPDPKAAVKVHAAYSYARALPKLKSLDRGLAETRINEAYKLFKPSNPEIKEIIKLLLTRANWKMQWKGRALDETLSFNTTGTCSSEEYPTWKLLDNMGVVCFRDRNQFGNQFGGGMGGGFGRRGPFGRGNTNNDNNNSNTNSEDVTKNAMQILVKSANRIDIKVLDGEGKLRSEGIGIPQ